MLTPFSQCSPGELEWTQKTGFKWSFELRQADRQFATLEWRSALGTLATATTAHGSWTFKRVGFWSSRVTVRVAGKEEDLAVFRPRGWTGSAGELLFADGTSIMLTREGFWSSTWHLRASGPDGDPDALGPDLVSITGMTGLFRWRANTTVHGASDPRAPMLTCLLWYLVVLAAQDATAATLGAASAAGAAAS